MTEKQKEYTLLNVKKNKTELEQLEKQANKNVWFLYGSIALAAIAFDLNNETEAVNTMINHVFSTLGWIGVYGGISSLKNIIFNVSKKAGVENAIERLDFEIQMAELEKNNEKGGPRR